MVFVMTFKAVRFLARQDFLIFKSETLGNLGKHCKLSAFTMKLKGDHGIRSTRDNEYLIFESPSYLVLEYR
jgi:hypothetical protein